jgi:hypothetical protein
MASDGQGCTLLVLFGSQTGNAQVRLSGTICGCQPEDSSDPALVQDVAERIVREAKLQLFMPRVLPMDAFDVAQLPDERFVVFVVSTTGQVWPVRAQHAPRPMQLSTACGRETQGKHAETNDCTLQGEPPDNMRRFWRFLLRKSLPPDSLSRTAFAVFGLGDSGYVQYNVSRWAQRHLGGTERIAPLRLHRDPAASAPSRLLPSPPPLGPGDGQEAGPPPGGAGRHSPGPQGPGR